jgi:hypothetical protein
VRCCCWPSCVVTVMVREVRGCPHSEQNPSVTLGWARAQWAGPGFSTGATGIRQKRAAERSSAWLASAVGIATGLPACEGVG